MVYGYRWVTVAQVGCPRYRRLPARAPPPETLDLWAQVGCGGRQGYPSDSIALLESGLIRGLLQHLQLHNGQSTDLIHYVPAKTGCY